MKDLAPGNYFIMINKEKNW